LLLTISDSNSNRGTPRTNLSSGQAAQAGYHGITDQLASVIRGQVERGFLICSLAIGASVLANKQREVRTALCHDLYSAKACAIGTGETFPGNSEGNAGVYQ
jgi:ribose 5-phosphate isomerase B